MQVRDAMTRDVAIVNVEETLQQAARMMVGMDAGILPVAGDGRLVGMLSDRDIAVRGIATGKGPDTKVREVMSSEVMYCFDDQDLDHIAKSMGEARVRRLPVIERESMNLVGILSLSDIALKHAPGAAGDALARLSEHGGPHSQTKA